MDGRDGAGLSGVVGWGVGDGALTHMPLTHSLSTIRFTAQAAYFGGGQQGQQGGDALGALAVGPEVAAVVEEYGEEVRGGLVSVFFLHRRGSINAPPTRAIHHVCVRVCVYGRKRSPAFLPMQPLPPPQDSRHTSLNQPPL